MKCSSNKTAVQIQFFEQWEHLDPQQQTQVLTLDGEFSHPWTQEQWRQSFTSYEGLLGVCAIDLEHGACGHIFVLHAPQDDVAHLVKIQVTKEKRNQGHASALLEQTQQKLREKEVQFLYLEVEETNWPALQFYLKQGFLVLRTIKHFYGQDRHALAMSKDLTRGVDTL